MANTIDWGQAAVNNTNGFGKSATNNTIDFGEVCADSWSPETNLTGASASALLLDTYSGASVAYSLRKLSSSYSGSAIRVRRSSDNTEQDIGFSGNDLDTASLLTFCGVGNGFVAEWYDQSGNANKAIQTTPTNQCQIVSSGAMITDVNTSKMTTTWTTDFYNLTSGISTNTKYFSISMFRRFGTADFLVHLGKSTSVSPSSLLWLGAGSAFSVRSYMSTLLSFQLVSTVGRCIMTSLKDASNLKVGYRNGVQLTSTATQAPSAGTLNVFGATSTLRTSGQYQEFIYWNSEQSVNRVGIETDINTYWDAY